jgi:Ca2+:H+ antiporter
MLGLGFVAGGFRRMEASYNNDLASIFGSLLTLSVAGLVLPTASQLLATPVEGGIVKQSRSIAIVFIIIYMGLLFYQLKSHESMFASVEDPDDDREIEERDNEILGTSSAVAVIAASTVFVGFNTYFAVNSLEGLLDTTNLTTSFVGIVLLPLFTNDPEPVQAAYKGDMDLCLQTTVGKCIQTTMFCDTISGYHWMGHEDRRDDIILQRLRCNGVVRICALYHILNQQWEVKLVSGLTV